MVLGEAISRDETVEGGPWEPDENRWVTQGLKKGKGTCTYMYVDKERKHLDRIVVRAMPPRRYGRNIKDICYHLRTLTAWSGPNDVAIQVTVGQRTK